MMDRLGHSTSKMTLEVYSHTTAAMQDQAVSALDALHEKINSQINSQTQKEDSAETRNAISDVGLARPSPL
jgi:hypothetical protein